MRPRFRAVPYLRITPFRPALALLLAVLAAPAVAHGQQTNPLADISKKTEIADVDRQAIRRAVQDRVQAMVRATRDVDRVDARQALIEWLKPGTPQFRAAGAAIATEELTSVLSGGKLSAGLDAVLIIGELRHPATRDALIAALNSRFAAVRYRGALGIQHLLDQLTEPSAYQPVIGALADAGERETSSSVVRVIYRALDFSQAQKDFTGANEVAIALARIFAARFEYSEHDPTPDAAGCAVALRIARQLKEPPTRLVAGLTFVLRRLVGMAREDAESVRVDVVESCETALHGLLEAHGVQTRNLPRVTDLIRAKADAKQLDAALAALLGAEDKPGVLNQAPWNLPVGG